MNGSKASQIFAIRPTQTVNKVSLERVWTAGEKDELAVGYNSAVTVKVGSGLFLFAYNKTTQQTDVYALSDGPPWARRVDSKINFDGGPWDSLDAFVFGNVPYLLTYRTDDGTFGFFRLENDFSVSPPYKFALPRNTPTKGFTTVAPFTSLGAQYMLGYNFNDGTVAIFSVAVTPSSTGNVPPLIALNVWYHRWAQGWTRFAFFQMGGANFFFKINTAKLNVNIDHVQDNPAAGTVEVGSYLQSQLPDALSIDVAARVPWNHDEPYLLTYVASNGATVVYLIHTDCQGWTPFGAATTVDSASIVTPYRVGDSTYVLFYRAGK